MKIQSAQTAQYKNTTNHIKATEEQQKKNQKEVASGKKVNAAADDAVAMAISEELMKQAKSLSAGSNNISYGIDAANIADGAMANIADSLGDIETNTIRAMNGLYSESDRAVMQQANEASIETINHIADTTKYNEKNLLDGSSGDMNIFTGTSSITMDEMDIKSVMADLENFTVEGNGKNITTSALDSAYSSLNSMRSKLGATTNGLEAAYSVNGTTEENTMAAYSRKADADMAESISNYKNSSVVNAAQNMALKNQMNSQENLVNRLLQQ